MMGLGPKSAEMLAHAGIATVDDLRNAGSIGAFVAVKKTGQPASLNLLWALEGALTNQPWKEVAKRERTRLLLALDLVER
ncbi:TfoX/Sxy family protein [Telluria antibiotica]|nr:TfoX/Sxy family protein [Telluria antibiotica]